MYNLCIIVYFPETFAAQEDKKKKESAQVSTKF